MRSFTEGCHWNAVSGGGSPSCWQSPVHRLTTITSTITGACRGCIAGRDKQRCQPDPALMSWL